MANEGFTERRGARPQNSKNVSRVAIVSFALLSSYDPVILGCNGRAFTGQCYCSGARRSSFF